MIIKTTNNHKQPQTMANYNYTVLLLGESGVGKTTWMNRMVSGHYGPTPDTSFNVSFMTNRGTVNFNVIESNVFDVKEAGRFDGAFLMYDGTRPNTFSWLNSFS
jgi:GTPase SAR1 family protein